MFTFLHYNTNLHDSSPTSDPQYKYFLYYFNKFDQFKITNLEDIPSGAKYCITLDISQSFGNFEPARATEGACNYNWILQAGCVRRRAETGAEILSKYPMPDRIWQDSGAGLVHWIFVWAVEGNMDDNINFKELLESINCQDHPENFTFSGACEIDAEIGNEAADYLKKELGINVIGFNSLYSFCRPGRRDTPELVPELQQHIPNKSIDIFNKKITEFKSVCYNRRGRRHRGLILAHMAYKEYAQDVIYSLGFPQELPNWSDFWLLSTDERFLYLKDGYNALQEGGTIQPIIRDGDINYEDNQAHNITYDHALRSSFQVVTESVPPDTEHEGRKRTFITEKSYKPFYMMQPFIIFGNKNTVKTLKKMGYKTFDKWIDHSYDNESNKEVRLIKFLIEMDRLHNISNADWADMLYDMLPDLLHNFELVMLPPRNNLLPQLTPILLRFFNT